MKQLKYTTEIDTLSLQLNFNTDNEQRVILQDILNHLKNIFNSYIDTVKYTVGSVKKMEYKIYCNNRTVLSFITGYSHNNYFIKIKFAGLKTYDAIVDDTSLNYLYITVAYINTKDIIWNLAELDVAIDIPLVNFDNLLAICTSKTATQYHILGEIQQYDGETTYIEKFDNEYSKNTAIKRSYLYNKALKEQNVHNHIPGFNLQRFEVKLQAPYFTRYGFDIDILIKTLDKYHLLYFNNINEKHALILRYNNHRSGIRQREIQRWQLDRYRLYYEVDYIRHFIYILTTITNEHIFGNTCV
jgi:hypothetical protein